MDKTNDIGLTRRGVVKESLTFRFDTVLTRRLREAAKKRKLTMTSIVEVALDRYLEE